MHVRGSLSGWWLARIMPKNSQIPNPLAVPYVEYPVSYRSRVELTANQTGLFVFSPFNDCLAGGGIQAAYPADGTTVVNGGFGSAVYHLVDPYLTSILATTSATPSTVEPPLVRCASFCVEMVTTTPISLINGDITVGRLTQASVPMVWGNFPVSFKQLSDQLDEDPNYQVLPAAALAQGKCVDSYMRDRNALEFTPVKPGFGSWSSYMESTNNPTGSVNNIGASQMWAPLVIRFGVPNGTYSTAVTFTVRATYHVSPPVGSAWSRVAVSHGIGMDEKKWWKMQQAVAKSSVRSIPDSLSRDASGVLGLPLAVKKKKQPVIKPRNPAAAKQGNKTKTHPALKAANDAVDTLHKSTAQALIKQTGDDLIRYIINAYARPPDGRV